MKNELRIIFMGTPDFAVATLKCLLDYNYKVVGVITAPDKPAGRGRKVHQSAVKTYAVSQGLTVLQPTNLKDEHFIQTLNGLKANLQIVVAFRMLPKVVWEMPEYGTFNLHASLLPNYRGAAPINWAIINGETETGVTTFFIDDKIDTGEVIFQEKVPITNNETAGTLHDKLMQVGADLVIKTVQSIESDNVITKKQENPDDLKTAYKIFPETCRIDWNEDPKTIYNHIRGLSPYPTAWSTLADAGKELRVKIYQADVTLEDHELETGTVQISKKELKVAVKGGYISLKELQFPGKKKTDIHAFLNGNTLAENAKFF